MFAFDVRIEEYFMEKNEMSSRNRNMDKAIEAFKETSEEAVIKANTLWEACKKKTEQSTKEFIELMEIKKVLFEEELLIADDHRRMEIFVERDALIGEIEKISKTLLNTGKE